MDITARIKGEITRAGDIASVRGDIDESFLLQLTQGTGTGKFDQVFTDERTITASGTENLDLAAVLADVFGATFTAAKVKAILVIADADNTNNVVLFGAASNPFNGPLSGTTPKVTLEPGCAFLFTSKVGWTVTAGTGDIILVANSGGGTPVTYRIVLLMASA